MPDRRPRHYADLVSILQDDSKSLTPSQERIAARVLSDPEGCAFMTVTELAQVVGVNESTVVRFATSLGLSGYPALVKLCRDELMRQSQLVRRFDALTQLTESRENLLDRAVSCDQANIARTFARIDSDTWDRAVDSLVNARRVYVLGLRKTYSISYLIAYYLRLVRDDVELLSMGSGDLPDRMRGINSEDVFVATGIYRHLKYVVKALQVASSHGAFGIALTDNPASPLSRIADVTFYVETTGVSVLRSITAFTSLAQTLVSGVSAQMGATSRSSLLDKESMINQFDTYVT